MYHLERKKGKKCPKKGGWGEIYDSHRTLEKTGTWGQGSRQAKDRERERERNDQACVFLSSRAATPIPPSVWGGGDEGVVKGEWG